MPSPASRAIPQRIAGTSEPGSPDRARSDSGGRPIETRERPPDGLTRVASATTRALGAREALEVTSVRRLSAVGATGSGWPGSTTCVPDDPVSERAVAAHDLQLSPHARGSPSAENGLPYR